MSFACGVSHGSNRSMPILHVCHRLDYGKVGDNVVSHKLTLSNIKWSSFIISSVRCDCLTYAQFATMGDTIGVDADILL